MKIPHSKPYFDANDEHIVLDTLRRKYVSSGYLAEKLGIMGASLLKKEWGIATQSGTDALTTALALLDLPPKSKVMTPAYICGAPLDALALAGLIPEPVDIEKETLSISVTQANKNKEASAVIGAHLFGIPAPLQDLENPNLIEDCAQTLLAENNGVTSGESGCLSICSFYATKLLTTGHGGLLAGNDPKLRQKAEELFKHDNTEEWEPHFHFLMSDFNAALGISQIEKLENFISERKKTAKRYTRALTGSEKMPNSIYSRFLTVAKNGKADEIIHRFNENGIEAKRPVYKPLYMYLRLDDKLFPNAKWAHDNIVSIPIYPGMSEKDQNKIEIFLEKNKNDLSCWPPA